MGRGGAYERQSPPALEKGSHGSTRVSESRGSVRQTRGVKGKAAQMRERDRGDRGDREGEKRR